MLCLMFWDQSFLGITWVAVFGFQEIQPLVGYKHQTDEKVNESSTPVDWTTVGSKRGSLLFGCVGSQWSETEHTSTLGLIISPVFAWNDLCFRCFSYRFVFCVLVVLTQATQEMLDNMLVSFLNGIHGFFSQFFLKNPEHDDISAWFR